jgi:hypothetical protein
MFSVFTILQIMGESSRVITARNSPAAAIAHAYALASAAADDLRRADEQRYKANVASDIYQVRFDANEVNTLLSVVHRPTGQTAISIRWLVQEVALPDRDTPRTQPVARLQDAECRP